MNKFKFCVMMALAWLMTSCVDEDLFDIPDGPVSIPSDYIIFTNASQWKEDIVRSGAGAGSTQDRVDNFDLLSDDGEVSLPVGVYVQDGIHRAGEDPATRGAVLTDDELKNFNVWAELSGDDVATDTKSLLYINGAEYSNEAGGADKTNVFNTADQYLWPGEGTIDFVAVGNTHPDATVTPQLNEAGTQLESFTYTVPADATKQNDIVVAKANDVDGNHNASVPLTFDHVMSAVNVKIGSVVEGEIRSITFKNVYNKGQYLVEQGVWVVDKTSVGDFTVKIKNGTFVSNGKDAEGTFVNDKDGGTFMMIPQNPGEKAEMVIEFYDAKTDHLYSDDETKNPYKPALRGSIAGDNWDKSKTVNYMLSIDESFTLKIEPVGKKLDAHYVIGYANVTVKGIDNWTIEATANDGADVTILPYSEVNDEMNPLVRQGFWTDYEVDENGNKIPDNSASTGRNGYKSARGLSSWRGSGDVSNKLFYIFIPENIGNTDRQINLTLRGTGASTASTTKVLLQKCPNWTTGGFGWEVVDDDEQGKYGFKWTRKVIFEHKYGWTRWFTGNGTGSWYKRNTAAAYATSLITQYNATAYATYGYFANNNLGGERMYIYIDYTKLNNLSTANSPDDGFSNTIALFNQGGGAASQAFETAILTAEKTKDDEGYQSDPLAFRNMNSVKDKDTGVTYTADNGSLNDLSGILTYILKKNRYNLQTTFDGYTTTLNPIISEDDIKWYLPAYGQFQYFTPDPNIAGDDKANYWSSTAVDGASQAYIGDGTPKDRDLQYRVIAVRKDEGGYGNATVKIDNSEMTGGENGSTDVWASQKRRR